MADLEDALKKLDRLTQEEARMAHVEVLRVTHSIRDGVTIVDGKVEEVGNQVQCVDDKVEVVIDGARGMFSQVLSPSNIKSTFSDGRQARVAAKDIGNKVVNVGVKVEEVGDKVEDVGDKVQCIDEKVDVVIDGVHGLSGQLSKPSNIYIFRRQASKSCGAGSKIGHSASCQRPRSNQVFVVS